MTVFSCNRALHALASQRKITADDPNTLDPEFFTVLKLVFDIAQRQNRSQAQQNDSDTPSTPAQ